MMSKKEVDDIRDLYQRILEPLFLPKDPVSNDIVNYFASILRIVGMEDRGWDPYLESRAILEDLNSFMQIPLPDEQFPNDESTRWRLGLVFYSHIVEMDAPYEVVTNLLRFQLGRGYSPNPYYDFLSEKEKKKKHRPPLSPGRKIEIIRTLSVEAGMQVEEIFDGFYDNKLRNAISHSDFILTETEFRCRSGTGPYGSYSISLIDLDKIITKAKAFISVFFGVEMLARQVWGGRSGEAVPYDPLYKGLMEVLVDEDELMCGFKVHWPNNSESVYRRTDKGIDMVNCMLDLKHSTIQFMVGLYARDRGKFSPLVEKGAQPSYTKLEGAEDPPVWPNPD